MLVSVDYSQIEMRLMAHLANDPAMLQLFHRKANDGVRFGVVHIGVECNV